MGTGVAKTGGYLPAVAKQVPTLIVAKNHLLTSDVACKLAIKSLSSTVHFGRHPQLVDEDTGAELEAADAPGICPLFHEVANPLGLQSQPVARVGCANCVHGHAAMAQIYDARGQLTAAAAARGRVAEWASARGKSFYEIKACNYILQMQDEPFAHNLIITAQAYTPSMADYRGGYCLEDRLTLVDESADLLLKTTIGQQDLLEWRSGLQVIAQQLPTGPVEEAPELDLAKVWELDAAIVALAKELVAVPQDQHELPPALTQAIRDFTDLGGDHLEGDLMPVAPWEQAHLDWWQYQHIIPLRALKALQWGIEHDGLSVVGGALICQSPSALAQDIFGRRLHTVIMDATPSPTIRALVGQVVQAMPGQPLKAQWHTARLHGRSQLRHKSALDREVRSIARVLDAMRAEAKQQGRKVGLLTFPWVG